MSKKEEKLTPMMEQYLEIKKKHKDEILFFRLGDFYEMFFEDAIIASKELEITLTKRSSTGENTPMCGVPYHVADSYISKLINKGYKVAICDQMEDPKLAKTIVKREVTKIVTPGTFTDFNYLKKDENNYLLCTVINNNSIYLSYTDYSTGELYTTSKTFFNFNELLDFFINECYRINPSEILINRIKNKKLNSILKFSNLYINYIEDFYESIHDIEFTNEEISLINNNIFNDIEKLKTTNKISDYSSIYILIKYLIKTQKDSLSHLNSIIYYNSDEYLLLDESSKRNLELVKGINTGNKSQSLLEILDKTKTSMGSRELKKWIEEPLLNECAINDRFDKINELKRDLLLLDDLKLQLKEIYDIERLSVKISNRTITPKEIISLLISLNSIKNIKNILISSDNLTLIKIAESLDSLASIRKRITDIIIDDPPVNIDENRFIKTGYSTELDELFAASEKGREWILSLEDKERKRTSIKGLKIKYNKILGYFIEVTKSYSNQVPKDYIRKQTLVGSERYFSIELKEMESKLLSSKGEAFKLQMEIYKSLKEFLADNIIQIQKVAKNISKLDVLVSLCTVAIDNNYVRPSINKDGIIEIKNGRHPIVELKLQEELFVPNDTLLDANNNLIHIITGPNMAGKSTYMRQVAIIVIMAHMGSYVPCESANISIVDKIFTRIGASDNLAKGDSTFMVEMKEVANIVKNATKNSLIILDEVGRGTSTYDGLSIAWALVEYLVTNIHAKTLFATHYHELVNLSNKYNNINNLTISVEKQNDSIVFLRKIVEGFSNNSYGIDVAKLAGINDFIIQRSNEILEFIQNNEDMNIKNNIAKKDKIKVSQKTIFDMKKDEFLKKLSTLNINSLSPIEALNLLNDIINEVNDII
ncbi:DNA mismatch repair protein MutS [Peptoniphilus mikwangii]|uniref:DNA mismatch repair protein MutS n=1 Tax=Peptoniphilus mikwangii TaxID=1354300 RepID=UPI000426B84B|nr:DNA mismatch repair protein MutS [Peptoniphilus mikwangii]